MKARQRKVLSELASICTQLGVELDGTSTCERKYIDRQRAHMLVHKVLYGVLCDHPENDFREEDFSNSEAAICELNMLKNKLYPDRNGSI